MIYSKSWCIFRVKAFFRANDSIFIILLRIKVIVNLQIDNFLQISIFRFMIQIKSLMKNKPLKKIKYFINESEDICFCSKLLV